MSLDSPLGSEAQAHLCRETLLPPSVVSEMIQTLTVNKMPTTLIKRLGTKISSGERTDTMNNY